MQGRHEHSFAHLPLWILGALFVSLGVALCVAASPMVSADAEWARADTTTGRVTFIEWEQIRGENRLKISYGYRGASGTIYHNTAIVPRRRGKLNLEPGAYVAVLYKPEDESQSRLRIELALGEWIPLIAIGVVEVLVGAVFISVAWRRLRRGATPETERS